MKPLNQGTKWHFVRVGFEEAPGWTWEQPVRNEFLIMWLIRSHFKAHPFCTLWSVPYSMKYALDFMIETIS